MIFRCAGFYRGPRPKTPQDFEVLKALGVTTTLDLETSQNLIGDHSPLREALTEDTYGIRCYAHPLSGILPPTLSEIRLAIEFIQNRPANSVYVHCEHGHERTGMICAAYRILKENWNPWDATKEAIAKGFHWYFVGFWFVQLWRLK